MDKQDKIILEGDFESFDQRTRNKHYYDAETYAKHLRQYNLRIRKNKINKIINNM